MSAYGKLPVHSTHSGANLIFASSHTTLARTFINSALDTLDQGLKAS